MSSNILCVTVIFYLACVSSKATSSNEDNKKLELVQVVFRHGERTASESEYSFLNHTDASVYQPFGLGQLTNNGRKQAYRLGLMLRERYDGYLSKEYRSQDLYAQSSHYDRTKMSLQLVLAGLYPPTEEFKWNLQLNWMPIPFRYTPMKFDSILQPYESRKFKSLHKQVFKSTKYVEGLAKFADIIDYLRKEGGFNIRTDTADDIMSIYNSLHINERMNISLPKWYNGNLKLNFNKLCAFMLDAQSFTPELKRINGGTLIKTLLDNMNVDEALYNPRKMYLYSGHELNIAAVVRALGLESFRYPDFSSAIILEKFRDSKNQLYVRLLGWEGVEQTLSVLNIGNCDEYCPIEKYLEIVSDVIPSEQEMNYIIDENRSSLSRDIFLNDQFVTKQR